MKYLNIVRSYMMYMRNEVMNVIGTG